MAAVGAEARGAVVAEAVAVDHGAAGGFPPAAEALAAAEPGAVGDMKPKIFINQLDDAKIVNAIAQAELRTSGEIRVFISTTDVSDPLEEAKRQFTRMGMEKTAERNSVLIFIAPKSQKFAIVGDTAVHAKCGIEFWNSTADHMRALFKQDKFTDALILAIKDVGSALERHFPRRDDDRDELPNAIEGN